jgi:hypothetical protein
LRYFADLLKNEINSGHFDTVVEACAINGSSGDVGTDL